MYCPRCGTIAMQNAAYCMQCGSQISTEPSSTVDVATPSPEAQTTNMASPPPPVTPAATNTVGGLLLLFCIGQTILIPLSQIFINFDLISRIHEITPYIGQQWGPLLSGQAFDALASALTLLLTQSYAILCFISGLLLWRRKLSGIAFLHFAFLLNATVVALSLVLASVSNHEDHDVATIGLYLLAWLVLGWQYFRYSTATQSLFHYDAIRFRQRRLLTISAAGTVLVLAGGLLSIKYAASSNRPDSYPVIIPVPPMAQNVSPSSPIPSTSEEPQPNSSEGTGAAHPSDLPPNTRTESPDTSDEPDRPKLPRRLDWGKVTFGYPDQLEKRYLFTNSSAKTSMGGDAFQVSQSSLTADGSTFYLLLGRGPCHDATCSSPLVVVTERAGRLVTIYDGRASGDIFVSSQAASATGYKYLAESPTGRIAQGRIIFPDMKGVAVSDLQR